LRLRIKIPIVDVSMLRSLPREKLITNAVHSTNKKLLTILNKVLDHQVPQKLHNFNFEAPRYIIHLQDQDERQQVIILQQGIIWVDEDKSQGFRIGGNLWQHLEKLFKDIPMLKMTPINAKVG